MRGIREKWWSSTRVSDDPYMSAAGIYDVHKIANNEKLVPRNWVTRDGSYVTQDFINYVEPLIQGDYQPFMVNGLPSIWCCTVSLTGRIQLISGIF